METVIRAVLFDLDGTILDRLSCLRVYLFKVVDRLPDVFDPIPFVEYMDRLIELDEHGHGDKYEVFPRLEREFGMAQGTWQRLMDDYEAYFPHVCVPFPNAHQTLARLREEGLKLGDKKPTWLPEQHLQVFGDGIRLPRFRRIDILISDNMILTDIQDSQRIEKLHSQK